MLLDVYATYELARAEHEERLRKAAGARLTALDVAARKASGQAHQTGPGVPTRNLTHLIRRLWGDRGSAAPAALKCASSHSATGEH
jgi:hypothetical protein